MTTPSSPDSIPDNSKEKKRLAENERMRLWRLAHKDDDHYRSRRNECEKVRRRKIAETADGRATLNAYTKEWIQENPDARKETMKRYRDTHKEQIKKYGKEYQAAYHKKNKRKIKDRELKRIYGITLEQWESQFESQDSKCAICGTDEPGKRNTWSTDHNHSTGEVRGILCHICNVMLGHCDDSIDRLERAISYLQNPPYKRPSI